MGEIRLLLGGVDDGKLGRDTVGMVGVLGSALRSTPGIFGVVDGAQTEVFGGWLGGGMLRKPCNGREKQKGCQREVCVCHAAILTYATGLHQKLGSVGYSHAA